MKPLILLLVFTILAGCQTVQVQTMTQTHVFDDRPEVGYVFGTISQTFVKKERSDTFDDSYVSNIFLDRKISGAKISYMASVTGGENNLVDPDFPGENGAIFVFELSAGHHQLDDWSAQEAYTTITPMKQLAPLKFEVIPGSILYLGNIHMNLSFGKNLFGAPITTDIVPEVRHNFKRDQSIFIRSFPNSKSHRFINEPLKKGFWPQLPE